MCTHTCACLCCDCGRVLATVNKNLCSRKDILGRRSSPPSLLETGSLGSWLLYGTGQLGYQLPEVLLYPLLSCRENTGIAGQCYRAWPDGKFWRFTLRPAANALPTEPFSRPFLKFLREKNILNSIFHS